MMLHFGRVVLIGSAIWIATTMSAFAQPVNFQRQLSVDELVAALADDDWVVVDARSTDAFNGWALDGIAAGGHVAGAVDFPANWIQIDAPQREEKLAGVLQTKGITPGKNVVVYSVQPDDRKQVAQFLHQRNFAKLYSFDLRDWITSNRKLTRYAQYQRLIPPEIAHQLVKGERPPTFADLNRIKFVEVSWGDEDASYTKGHIPGSFHVNTDHFEPPPTWYLGSPKVLTKFANDYGFQADDTVILSGEDVTASYRLAVVLEYMGVADVRVLNGGLAAWKRAGYPVETERHDPPKSNGFGKKIPLKPEMILSIEATKKELQNQNDSGKPSQFTLVDTRTWAEFVGEKSGYSYHTRKGRVPGALYGQAEHRGSNSMLPYRNVDGTMRNPDEIAEFWKRSGINPEHHLSFMCGGGWRAAEVMTYARVAGIKRTTLFSDGWIGWSNDPANPIQTGLPK